ncbi:helix-turn-helix domain-containing protein [Microbispora sp. NPDC046933]|uniref:helix-turn-helix domain-containing protein n=1 Tax=Microbispora sp. NPDC046933 TaxID=3155618 RepID=UPI0033FFBD54
MAVVKRIRTAKLDPQDRFDYWFEVIAQAHAPAWVSSRQPGEFLASLELLDLGQVQITKMRHPPLTADRTARQIRQCDPEVIQLNLLMDHEATVQHHGRSAAPRAGQFLLLSSSSPYKTFCRGRMNTALVVQAPREALPLSAAVIDQVTAVPFPARGGVAGVFSRYLLQLLSEADEYGPGDEAVLARVAIDLLTATCARQAEAALPSEVRRQALMVRIDDFVRRRLGDPALSPDVVAAAHQISTRYLHKLFRGRSLTVAAWIRHLRLENCRRDLADPRLRDRPVHAVAARWGLVDAAHFSRLFRSAYGVSPQEYRRSLSGDQDVRASSWAGRADPRTGGHAS